MRVLALCTVLVACGGGTRPPADPTAASLLDCGKVADHVSSTVAADKPRAGLTPAAVRDMIAARCQTDAWGDETRRCMHAIANIREGRACASTMTDEQRTAIREQARALRKDANEPAADDSSADWIRHVVEEPGTPTR